MIGKKELDRRFGPIDEVPRSQGDQMAHAFRMFAFELDVHLPDGREKSLALTALEESFLWSVKAGM